MADTAPPKYNTVVDNKDLDQVVAGASAVQSHNWVGQHIPLHATSNGKVLLSELDDAELKRAVPVLPRVTDRTFARIREIGGEPLRVAVEGGGCSGFTYKFELGEPEAEDVIAETEGVRLVVDPVSLDLLEGSEVDYVEDLGGAAFKVQNPNAASGCGCGSSFSV